MDLIGVLLLVLILANTTIYIWFLSKFFDGILFYFPNSKGPQSRILSRVDTLALIQRMISELGMKSSSQMTGPTIKELKELIKLK